MGYFFGIRTPSFSKPFSRTKKYQVFTKRLHHFSPNLTPALRLFQQHQVSLAIWDEPREPEGREECKSGDLFRMGETTYQLSDIARFCPTRVSEYLCDHHEKDSFNAKTLMILHGLMFYSLKHLHNTNLRSDFRRKKILTLQ